VTLVTKDQKIIAHLWKAYNKKIEQNEVLKRQIKVLQRTIDSLQEELLTMDEGTEPLYISKEES
jgi:hypothetical protein